MYLGIFAQGIKVETKRLNDEEEAYTWMYGKMMRSLKQDCDCMNCLENLEGYIRFLGMGGFLVEDDDSVMGEGTMSDKEITYDAIYGRSFAIKIVDLDAC